MELDASVESGLTTFRLDVYLTQKFPSVSRSRWSKLISNGTFIVNGFTAKASTRLEVGQTIEISEAASKEELSVKETKKEEPKGLSKEQLNSLIGSEELEYRFDKEPEILFEDSHIMVLNKPAGLTVHQGAGIPLEETLVAWLLKKGHVSRNDEHLNWGDQVLEEARPGIVHRLDRGTSGCLVVAKDPKSHENLSQQFAKKLAGRHYWAWIDGNATTLQASLHRKARMALEDHPSKLAFRVLKNGKHSLAAPLGRDPRNRLRYAVIPETGKRAITHFQILDHNKVSELFKNNEEVIQAFGISQKEFPEDSSYSILDVALETGRTHQIRVHLAFLGVPILGDALYGGQGITRMLLHAHTLYLTHPATGKEMKFSTIK